MIMHDAIKWDRDRHGALLRQARASENMTRKDVAEAIESSYMSVLNWEQGRNAPQRSSLNKLVELFGEEAFGQEGASSVPEEMNALASWLSEQRERARLTRHQLAERAGVTYQTIHSIETGRTTNPQQSTLGKLEGALQAELPEEVDQDIRESADVGVEGVGRFTDFDPHVEDELPNVPGIYVFYDVSDRPVYVGESGNIGDRIRNRQNGHWDKFWYRAPIVDKAAYVRVDDSTLRKQIEAVMIKFMKSNAVINRKHVDR